MVQCDGKQGFKTVSTLATPLSLSQSSKTFFVKQSQIIGPRRQFFMFISNTIWYLLGWAVFVAGNKRPPTSAYRLISFKPFLHVSVNSTMRTVSVDTTASDV